MGITWPTLTARALLQRLRDCGPAVEGDELVFAVVPPDDLGPPLSVLQTGVRALLVERRWWGSGTDRPLVVELDPDAPIPTGVGLLAVEGEATWDRIHPSARTKLLHLFAPNLRPVPSGAAVSLSRPRNGQPSGQRLFSG